MVFGRKKNKERKKVRNNASRATGTRILAQGAGGRAPRKAFGGVGKQHYSSSVPKSLPAGAWDATCSSHAALPRAVGPYTVVRTTRMFTSSAPTILFGTFTSSRNAAGGLAYDAQKTWSNVIAAEAAGSTPVAGTLFRSIPSPSGKAAGSTFSCVPAALTVQVMCPQSVMMANGQCAMAVVPARIDLTNSQSGWLLLNAELISYFKPRLLTGGKLALRGVQASSMPLSMTQCSEFLGMTEHVEGGVPTAQPWNTAANLTPEGWAPIVFINGTASNLPEQPSEFTFLVTVEWRVRFEMDNPAVSSHTHHGVSTDSSWEEGIRRATAILPGIIDIVEKVANATKVFREG